MKKDNILWIAIAIFIILNLIVLLKIVKMDNKKVSNTTSNSIQVDETNNVKNEVNILKNETTVVQTQVDNKIKNMSEASRIRNYCAKYFDAIEKKKYETAYAMLNENFKNNYFKDEESFESYAKTTYPTGTIYLNYNSVERKGEIFQLQLTINDEISQTMIVRENDANNFTISFSVNQ